MILSYKNNFLFLKTLKTAGTSFEIALSKYVGNADIVTPITAEDETQRAALGYSGPQNYLGYRSEKGVSKNTLKRGKFYNHIPASEVMEAIGSELFGKLLKVAITRNPYDMIVSRYFWDFRKEGHKSPGHFRQWLRSRPTALLSNHRITHINEENVINFTMRFENLEEDISQFASMTGLPSTLYAEFNAIRAKGQYRPKGASTKMMFENFEDGVSIIGDLFKDEIKKYNYTVS